MNLKHIMLVLAALTTGLTAGVFFGYQVSIIPAFTALSNTAYIDAMQRINNAIQNPAFLVTFMSPAIFLPVATYLRRKTSFSLPFTFLFVATCLYIVGTFGVTMAANVPLNDALAAFSFQTATPEQIATARTAFQDPWNFWHLIRTVASVGSFLLIIIASLSASDVRSVPSR
ncbi:membrane protein [Dictyobacter alpinus]|uniref:Membrane protein n=1 Tax=Dictyobacter alpinus TaxID=2014873 RepID=A0A402BFJ2_9CHLR|nr:anthrone oxygenase family protein [Dictyobacter alpinus]GCE30096.1 membrane protein [Dictyobacter alpinus]